MDLKQEINEETKLESKKSNKFPVLFVDVNIGNLRFLYALCVQCAIERSVLLVLWLMSFFLKFTVSSIQAVHTISLYKPLYDHSMMSVPHLFLVI